MMDVVQRLSQWYLKMCDGDWEHQSGVTIGTLDNPGWLIDIDLIDTPLEEKHFDKRIIDRSKRDWIHCEVKEGKFKGHGGPENLGEILELFLDWAAEEE